MCIRDRFYTPPLQDGVIHSDNTNWLDWTKIYFQYGAEGSTLRWWESDKVMEYRTDTKKDDYHGQVLIAEEDESTLIYEKDLSTPHLVNVGKLHSSHNPTNKKRFVVTLALHDLEGNRILWNDALSKLSKKPTKLTKLFNGNDNIITFHFLFELKFLGSIKFLS